MAVRSHPSNAREQYQCSFAEVEAAVFSGLPWLKAYAPNEPMRQPRFRRTNPRRRNSPVMNRITPTILRTSVVTAHLPPGRSV